MAHIGTLQQFALKPLSDEDIDATIQELMTNGKWDSTNLNVVLPRDVIERIEVVFMDGEIKRNDKTFWKFSSSGDFSSKSPTGYLRKRVVVTGIGILYGELEFHQRFILFCGLRSSIV